MRSAVLLRRFWQALPLVVMTLLSGNALADTAKFLHTAHALHLQSILAINNFYNYSDGLDRAALAETNGSLSMMETLSDELASEGEALKLQEKTGAIVELVTKMRALFAQNIDFLKANGYPELQPVADLAADTATLGAKLQEVYLDAKAVEPGASNDQTDRSRFAAIHIASLMSRYSVRTLSSVSQIFQGAEGEKPIDELAVEFDGMVAQLNAGASNDEQKAILKTVDSKWEFVKKSYINYNENAVPYLINLYSKKIVTALEELSTSYAGG